MIKKTEVKICSGTMCYIMGGAGLHLLKDRLPSQIKDHVSVYGIPCLNICQDESEKRPPYVQINGVLMDSATIDKILKQLKIIYNDLL